MESWKTDVQRIALESVGSIGSNWRENFRLIGGNYSLSWQDSIYAWGQAKGVVGHTWQDVISEIGVLEGTPGKLAWRPALRYISGDASPIPTMFCVAPLPWQPRTRYELTANGVLASQNVLMGNRNIMFLFSEGARQSNTEYRLVTWEGTLTAGGVLRA